MLNIIYASPHQAMLSLLRQQPEFHFLCLVEQRDHLKAACDQLQPDVLLVSEQLPGDTSIPLYQQLIDIKQHHPSIRLIYLAGPTFLQHPQAKKHLKTLHQHGIYHVHLQNDLDATLLLRYFYEEFGVEHLEAQSGFDLSTHPLASLKEVGHGVSSSLASWMTSRASKSHRSPADSSSFIPSAFDTRKGLKRQTPSSPIQLPTFSLPQLSWKVPTLPQWDLKSGFKTYGPPAALMVVALSCFYLSAKPVLDAKQGVNGSMSEWEALKESQAEAFIPTERPVIEDSQDAFHQQKENQQSSSGSSTSSSSSTSKPSSTKPEDTLLGLIKISEKGKSIGIRPGTSDAVLNKGAGLDESGVGLGEKGNTIIYGHREEVFWDLKDIKIGQLITLETFSGTYTYQVTKTRVTYPQDTSIYDASPTHKLTLVTCHPFVYMGATPERFVVEAELVKHS